MRPFGAVMATQATATTCGNPDMATFARPSCFGGRRDDIATTIPIFFLFPKEKRERKNNFYRTIMALGKIAFRVLLGIVVTLLIAAGIVVAVLLIQGRDLTGENALNLVDEGFDGVREQLYPLETPPESAA